MKEFLIQILSEVNVKATNKELPKLKRMCKKLRDHKGNQQIKLFELKVK